MPDVNPYAPPQQETLDPHRPIGIGMLVDEEQFLRTFIYVTSQVGAGQSVATLAGLILVIAVVAIGGPIALQFDWSPGNEANILVFALASGALLVGAALLPGFLRQHFVVVPWVRRETARLQAAHPWLQWGEWWFELQATVLRLRTPGGTVAWNAKEVKVLALPPPSRSQADEIYLETPEMILSIPGHATFSEPAEAAIKMLRRRCLSPAFIGWK